MRPFSTSVGRRRKLTWGAGIRMGNRCLRRDAEQAGGVLAGTSGRSLDAVYICGKEGGMSHEGKGLGLAKLVGLAWQRN